MVTLFIRDTGRAICVLVFPILQSKNKSFNQNCSEERVSRNSSQTLLTLGRFSGKTWRKILQKLKQWWAWEIELIACYITVRIPPNSLISPGCCILQVCAPAGVYKRGGAPAFLTFCFILFLFYCRQNTYVIGDGNNACILDRNLLYKKVFPHHSIFSKYNNIYLWEKNSWTT